jgi:hypothetical protein
MLSASLSYSSWLPHVHDENTGVAMYGFDVVAFFTREEPVLGSEQHEVRYEGIVWRFTSSANLDAFISFPEIYAPQFRGFDPVQIARGTTTSGTPEYWMVADQKLYLFYSPTTRTIFELNKDRILRDANKQWPKLSNEY